MRVNTYADAQAFLEGTEVALESQEAANSLMLGVAARLVQHPERIQTAPCLKSVDDDCGLVLAALMTPPHNLTLYAHRGDLDQSIVALADALCAEHWAVPGVLAPQQVAQRFAQRWAALTGKTAHLRQRLRAYELREVLVPPPQRGQLRLATAGDTALVALWRCVFQQSIFGAADPGQERRAAAVAVGDGDVYLWEDERPVSMAARNRPTRHGISVSYVYTPPEFRRRGYASACVAELSRTLLCSGWAYCALFADLANPTANGIYQRIGYIPVCDYAEYTFP
jgi:uncharacterized protein